jgi:tetratricopeptide (TPR) repeat protein
MNKSVLFVLAILVSTMSFAQKKELRAADKAIKSNNYAEAKAALSQVKSMMTAMDDKQKSQYHLLMAEALYAKGTANNEDINAAIENLSQVGSDFKGESAELSQLIENELLTKANSSYTSSNFIEASNQFEQLYKVVPADTTYLYYSAVSAVSAQDYEKALAHYIKLNDLGYTGKEKVYFATNKETGEEEIMSKQNRDIYMKTSDDYIKPGERLTESKAGEITKNIALIYVQLDKKDEAISAIKKARVNEPTNVDLILTEANLQYKIGNTDAYKSLIQEAIKLDPKNVDLIYNLGVLSAEAKDKEAAKGYYKQVIEMDPSYVNALTNLSALILEDEQAVIEEMNGLGNSSADNKRYDELKQERINIYNNAIPYLNKVLDIEPNSVQVARTLMNIYSAIGDTDNQKKMKAIVDDNGE